MANSFQSTQLMSILVSKEELDNKLHEIKQQMEKQFNSKLINLRKNMNTKFKIFQEEVSEELNNFQQFDMEKVKHMIKEKFDNFQAANTEDDHLLTQRIKHVQTKHLTNNKNPVKMVRNTAIQLIEKLS